MRVKCIQRWRRPSSWSELRSVLAASSVLAMSLLESARVPFSTTVSAPQPDLNAPNRLIGTFCTCTICTSSAIPVGLAPPMRLNHHRAGSGEPLVLIHGIGSRWQMWEPVLDRLTPDREVIALDLPGFGASPMPPPGTPAGPESLTSLVHDFLVEIGLDRPHVAGQLAGGARSPLNSPAADRCARPMASRRRVSPTGASRRSRAVCSGRASAPRGASSPHADALLRPRAGRIWRSDSTSRTPTSVTPADAAASLRALADAPWFDATLATINEGHFGDGAGIDDPGNDLLGRPRSCPGSPVSCGVPRPPSPRRGSCRCLGAATSPPTTIPSSWRA